MENSLDSIAVGDIEWTKYLKDFYLGKKGLKEKVEAQDKAIKPEESRTISLPQLKNEIEIKVGRFGPYVIAGKDGSEEVHASIPEDIAPADLKVEDIRDLLEMSKNGPEPIGNDPKSGEPIFCLVGRYGPYLQLGEKTEANPKPRRASLTKDITPKNITLEQAIKLLSLPRELGKHPTTGKMIVVNNGRFGPYAMHDGEFRSLKKDDDVYTVTLERAVELLSEEKKGRGGAKVLKDLGQHPKTKKKMAIYDGKYGAYVKHGTKNITLPEEHRSEAAIEKLTLEQVAKIVDEAKSKK
jgi:DNA topoisomerase-1